MSSSGYSDDELLKWIKDPEHFNYGFNLLMRQYREKLYWFIRKMLLSHDDSDDVLQDSFIKVYHNILKFRAESSIETWLYSIAYRTSIDFLKKKQRRMMIPIYSMSEVLESQLKADPYFDGDEAEKKLQQALAKLPDRQREVFILSYFEEMSIKEVAHILDLSLGAVKASAHLAREKIKKFIED